MQQLVNTNRDNFEIIFIESTKQKHDVMLDNASNIADTVEESTPRTAKRNYFFYMDTAEKARQQGDHNTALMMKTAMGQRRVLSKLKKQREKDLRIHTEFERIYGTPNTKYMPHRRYLRLHMQPHELPALQAMRNVEDTNTSNLADAIGFINYNMPGSPLPVYNSKIMLNRRHTW